MWVSFIYIIVHIRVYILPSLDYPLVKHLMNISCLRVTSSNYTLCQVWEFLHLILKETIHKAFSHRNCGSKFVVLGYNSTYFSNKIHKGKTCYSEEQVISMLEFLIANIFVSFGGTLFQQVVGIPMGTNCAPLLADLFLYSYELEFLQKLVKDKKIHEARAFNFTYRYIDDVLSINNSSMENFFHWYILQSWKLKRPPIQLRPHHFWTYTSNLTTVVNSVLKFMISGTTSILKS